MKIEIIKNFFKKYKRIFLPFIIIIIFHIFLSYYLKLNDNEIKNIYKYFLSIIWIIFLIYSFLFNLQNTEKFLVKNITIILLISIIWILHFQETLWIKENDKILLMVWWIFAFWYWYKKYERDQEINLLKTYWEKYDNIKTLEINYKIPRLLNLRKEEFYLREKLYISADLWEIWEKYIIRDLSKIFISMSRNEIPNEILIKEIRDIKYSIQDNNFYRYLKEKSFYINNENKEIIWFIYKKYNKEWREKIKNIFYKNLEELQNKYDDLENLIKDIKNFIKNIENIKISKRISILLKDIPEEGINDILINKESEFLIIHYLFKDK